MIVNNQIGIPKLNIKPNKSSQASFGMTNQLKVDTVHFGATEKAENKGTELAVLKSIGKGLIKPISDIFNAVVKAPLATGLIVAATAAIIHFLPILGTVLAVGVCGFGAYQMATGVIKGVSAARAQKNAEVKDYTNANKQFEKVGEGLFDFGLTANAALKGIKEVKGTISAISEASKAAAAEKESINAAQKLYAILKQVQNKNAVKTAPTKLETVFQRIVEDGKNEFLLLKQSGKISKSTKDLEEVIKKISDPAKKQQLLELLDKLSDVTKHSPQAEKIAATIQELLKAEKISSTETARILELIDATREQPAVLAVLKSAMKTGTVDDAVKTINKMVGATRYGDDAVKAYAGIDNTKGLNNSEDFQ